MNKETESPHQLPPCGISPQPLPTLDIVLTKRQIRFVDAIAQDDDRSGTKCAIDSGYAESSAAEMASHNLKNPHIQKAITERRAQLAAVAGVDVAMVVRDLLDIATADPRELVSVHRDCCRYCWGDHHLRQWTQGEYGQALDEVFNAEEAKAVPPLAGGLGFNPTREPHPDCPECFGRGIESVVITDTRKLSAKAAKLYAGAQQTKEGIKVLMANQGEARQGLGRYLGMFTDKTQVSGPGGGPIPLLHATVADMTDEQLLAIAGAGIASLGVELGTGTANLGVDAGVSIMYSTAKTIEAIP